MDEKKIEQMMEPVNHKPRRLKQSSSLIGMFDPIPSIIPATIVEEHSMELDEDEKIIPAPTPLPLMPHHHREHLLQVNRNLRRAKRRLLLESVQQLQESQPDPIAQFKALTLKGSTTKNNKHGTDIPNPFNENSINVSNAKAA